MIKRTEKEIQKQIDSAISTEENSRWPGNTYEAGVRAALEWVSGMMEFKPMGEEE